MSMSQPDRVRLDRARVLTAAVALADDEGLDGVSMRTLAAGLAVVPMALYKHVANKQALLAGMIDTIVTGYPRPEPHLDWRDAVRFRVLAARDALVAHPWLRAAIETSGQRTPAVLAHMDAVAGDLLAGGLSADLAHHAMHALGHRIWGFSPEAFDDSATASTPEESLATEQLIRDRFPHIVAITLDSLERTGGAGCDSQYEFEFTLDLLLDAFERLHDSGWSSGRHLRQ
ncbi:MAG: TetR/AcrR family transcriptional regulator C-terminal domain-containing protein [Micropruina sp.]|uniref:TetR/AcrR family transcriptional regulator n=1 Tax=Micropruina sp. TaxID=2737536 RepID=UPI0039E35689